MTPPKSRPALPALALPPAEAAASLGMAETAFREHVAPHVRCVRIGRMRLFPVSELARWVDSNANYALEDDG